MRGPSVIRRRSGPGLFTEARRNLAPTVWRTIAAVVVTLWGLGLISLFIEALRGVLK
jgi:hypothetical protein